MTLSQNFQNCGLGLLSNKGRAGSKLGKIELDSEAVGKFKSNGEAVAWVWSLSPWLQGGPWGACEWPVLGGSIFCKIIRI